VQFSSQKLPNRTLLRLKIFKLQPRKTRNFSAKRRYRERSGAPAVALTKMAWKCAHEHTG